MILIAIRDDELRDVVEAALEHYGSPYPCRIVKSAQEVQAALQTQAVRCLVMTVDVALAGDDGRGGLLQQLPQSFRR
jgi:CheY-like chemotaxis protein